MQIPTIDETNIDLTETKLQNYETELNKKVKGVHTLLQAIFDAEKNIAGRENMKQ